MLRRLGETLVPIALVAVLIGVGIGLGQSSADALVSVTVDNFVRAESDLYLGNMLKESSLGKVAPGREPASIDNRAAIKANSDTLYSAAVFDLDAGPVT